MTFPVRDKTLVVQLNNNMVTKDDRQLESINDDDVVSRRRSQTAIVVFGGCSRTNRKERIDSSVAEDCRTQPYGASCDCRL